MKISIENSCYMISKKKKFKTNLRRFAFTSKNPRTRIVCIIDQLWFNYPTRTSFSTIEYKVGREF
ncbi:hypothetical protein BpHYR1_009772 [Brachionus plicatilis]|uniref:Uncharacterized protein n=1 Tax=Brachionus plicatilis TaxID=10195 RepID=A0A3M7T9T3_BRAPC|nr:hypothetical protein BpHYR1_009772 [Brachionus plicatilis]